MPPLPTPLRIILCGRKAAIGKPVAASLLPEYEVIHFIQSVEAGKAEIPKLLAGQDPQPTEPNDVGTHDYSEPARVVLFGRGYQRSEAEEIRRQCVGSTSSAILWLVSDPAKVPAGVPPPGYAEKTAGELRGVLDAWRAEGGVKDGLLEY